MTRVAVKIAMCGKDCCVPAASAITLVMRHTCVTE